MSETVCDLANQQSQSSPLHADPHQMEQHASPGDNLSYNWTPRALEADTPAADVALGAPRAPGPLEEPAPPSNQPLKQLLGSTDVFVDNFIQLGQGSRQRMLSLR